MSVDRLLLLAAALTTGAAGAGHLSAARDHPAHWHITAFFVVLALAQVAWAAGLVWRPSGRLLRAGIVGNAAVVVLWVFSRTTGLVLIEGTQHVEAVGMKDVVVTFLELLAVAAIGLALVLPDEARRATVAASDRVVPALFAGVMLLALPATLGGHGHGAGHGVHGHDQAEVLGESAAAHEHGEGDVVEAHGQVADHHVEEIAAPGHAHGAAGSSRSSHAHADDSGDAARPPAHPGGEVAVGRPAPLGQLAAVRYGPFTLPPVSSNGVRHDTVVLSNTVLTQLPPPCRDCVLTSVDIDMVYEDGRSANYDTGAMLHHHVMFDSTETDPTCGRFDGPVGGMGKRIFAAGNERTSGAFPRGFGYPVDRDDWWTGIFELMNMTEQPQVVWVNVAVRHVPAGDERVRPVEPIWLDVDNCSDSEFDVAAGRTTTTWDWTSTVTGRVVLAAGHVHDGGVSIAMSNETTGTRICKSVAGYGTKPEYMGHIESMSACSWDRIGVVRAGDVLRLSTVYDSAEPLEGVMGIMMAFVYETDDLTGGTAAPASATDPPESGERPTVAPHEH